METVRATTPAPDPLDNDLDEILALLRYIGPDDSVRKALLPILRLHVANKEAVALPFLGRPRKRIPRSAGLVAGLCLMLPHLCCYLAL